MRKQKIIYVEFDDGVKELPSSMKVKCNVTGELVHFYVPNMAKVIRKKYNNNFQHFIDTYVSRTGKREVRTPANGESEQEDLSQYRNVLVLQFNAVRDKKDRHSRNIIEHVKEVWGRRFGDIDLSQAVSAL